MQTSILKSETIKYAVDCYFNITLCKNFTGAYHLVKTYLFRKGTQYIRYTYKFK